MAKKPKPMHVVEFRLKATASDIKKVDIRLNIARKMYNCVLAELLRRDSAMRSSAEYKATSEDYRFIKAAIKKLPEQSKRNAAQEKEFKKLEKERQAISKRFNELSNEYGVSVYALNTYSKTIKNGCYFQEHLDANTIQKIDVRVFAAYQRWRFERGGKPRFKGINRAFKSLEGKSNKQGIVIKIGDGSKKIPVTSLVWNKLSIPLELSKTDKHGYQAAALELIGNGEIAYSRIIKRQYKGKDHLYVQCILKGSPFIKAFQRKAFEKANGKRVGLDLGVSSLAYYSGDKAGLLTGVAELKLLVKKIAKHQKRASRLLRLANANNYKLVKKRKGRKEVTVWQRKKNVRDTNRPHSYLREQATVRELHRKLAAKRKYLHDVYANEILSCGNQIFTENVSVKAWKTLFGKSIGYFAPSALISTLKRKAANADGKIVLIKTQKARLSQYDHVTNEYVKKKLGDRTAIVDGVTVQRDLYSAFLAYCIDNKQEKVDRNIALKEWSGARQHLDAAFDLVKLSAKGGDYIPSSAGIATRGAVAA